MFQSPQATTIAILYFIMFFTIAFLTFKNMQVFDALKVLTPFLITTLLLVYDTDCLVTGGCYVYSWIRTILYLISIIIVITVMSLTSFTKTSLPTIKENAQQAPLVATTSEVKKEISTKPEEKKTETPVVSSMTT